MYDGTCVICVHVVGSLVSLICSTLQNGYCAMPIDYPTPPLLDERIITWTTIMPYRWHLNRAYNTLYSVSPNKNTLRKCRLYAFLSWRPTTSTFCHWAVNEFWNNKIPLQGCILLYDKGVSIPTIHKHQGCILLVIYPKSYYEARIYEY
jgi:hypothetical protein